MFDKFGEFDSAEELNRAAAAQRDEGDEEALVALALENGIDREDAEDFMDRVPGMDELCTPYMAALGKLKVEKEEMKLKRELQDLAEEVETECQTNEAVAAGVRRKGKSLAAYLAKIIDAGYKNAILIPAEITREVKEVPAQYRNQIRTGMPSKAERLDIMRRYYGEVTG